MKAVLSELIRENWCVGEDAPPTVDVHKIHDRLSREFFAGSKRMYLFIPGLVDVDSW